MTLDIDAFPGMGDQEKVRQWVIGNIDNLLKPCDEHTPALKDVARDPKVFSVIYRLMEEADEQADSGGQEPVFRTKDSRRFMEFGNALNDDEVVENPLLFISLAGLLIQVVMFIRSHRKDES